MFTPLVIGPSSVPIVTDEAQARAEPELAVLSAMAHGRDADADTVQQRLASVSTAELDAIGERLLGAASLREALG